MANANTRFCDCATTVALDQSPRRPGFFSSSVRRRILLTAASVLALSHCRLASAQVGASGQITAQLISPGEWQYNITLSDTGTTNIETLWFAWIPGEGFLHSQPTNIVAPTGWSDGIFDTYSVRFVTTTNPLISGNTLSGFQFDSADSPSQVFGLSQAFPTTPVGTSVVYEGAPLTTSSAQIVVTPEPSTLVLGGLAFLGLAIAARRHRAKSSAGRR